MMKLFLIFLMTFPATITFANSLSQQHWPSSLVIQMYKPQKTVLNTNFTFNADGMVGSNIKFTINSHQPKVFLVDIPHNAVFNLKNFRANHDIFPIMNSCRHHRLSKDIHRILIEFPYNNMLVHCTYSTD